MKSSCRILIVLTALLLSYAGPQVATTNINSEVTVTMVDMLEPQNKTGLKWQRIMKRKGTPIAITSATLMPNGKTNLGTIFIIDRSTILAIEQITGEEGEKLYLVNSASKNVEAFSRQQSGELTPFSAAEIEKYKKTVMKFE